MFGGFGRLIDVLLVLSVVGLTLGLWKLVELILWVVSHVRWV